MHPYRWIIILWRNICIMACINKLLQILCCLHRTGWIKTRPAQKLLVRVKFTGNLYSYRTCCCRQYMRRTVWIKDGGGQCHREWPIGVCSGQQDDRSSARYTPAGHSLWFVVWPVGPSSKQTFRFCMCHYTLLDVCAKFSFVYGNNQRTLLYKNTCFAYA